MFVLLFQAIYFIFVAINLVELGIAEGVVGMTVGVDNNKLLASAELVAKTL